MVPCLVNHNELLDAGSFHQLGMEVRAAGLQNNRHMSDWVLAIVAWAVAWAQAIHQVWVLAMALALSHNRKLHNAQS